MARPISQQPTPAELEVLKVMWENGPQTVRDVWEKLHRRQERAYTSVMSLLVVMAEKGLLARKTVGRAHLYSAKASRRKTLGRMAQDLLQRVYSGSVKDLVAHMLEDANPSPAELAEVRKAISIFEKEGR